MSAPMLVPPIASTGMPSSRIPSMTVCFCGQAASSSGYFSHGRLVMKNTATPASRAAAILVAEDAAPIEGKTLIRVADPDGRLEGWAPAAQIKHRSDAAEPEPAALEEAARRAEAAGVVYSNKGIEVDARLRTSNKRIFAIGDVAEPPETDEPGFGHDVIGIEMAAKLLELDDADPALDRSKDSD